MDSKTYEAFIRILSEEEFDKEALFRATTDLVSDHKDSPEWCDQYKAFTRGVRELCWKTHSTVKRYARSTPIDEGFLGLTPSAKNLEQVITYSHKLAYSSFAPSNFVMGGSLGAFKPPAPQAQQFLASKLHDFAEQYIGRKRLKTEKSITEAELISEKSPSESTPQDSFSSKSPSIEEEEFSPEDSENKGLEIELDVSKEDPATEEVKTEEAEIEGGFGFVLNPDLELSENNSPASSSVEQSSSDEE